MQGICRVYAYFMQAFCCLEFKTYYYESYFIKSMHLPYGHA